MHMVRMEKLSAAQYFDLKLSYEIGPRQLYDAINDEKEALQVVDLRDLDDFERGHIPGAIHLAFPEPEDSVAYLYHLNKNIPVVVYSSGLYCTRGYECAYTLARNGFRVKNLIGGWEGWMHYALPVEPPSNERLQQYQMIDGV